MKMVSLVEINSSQLSSLSIVDGQLICCLDTSDFYRDIKNSRLKLSSDIIFVNSLPLAPLYNRIYFLTTDCVLYTYLNDDWVAINMNTNTLISELNKKVDKVSGKGLSTNDFTNELKTKLDGIATGANKYTLPTASSSTLGGVKIGSNITNSSGTISITKANVTAALGYTPPTQDTNTHYASKNVVGSNTATSNTTSALTNGNVYLNSVENGAVTSSHKISGSGATTVTTDTSGNIIVKSTNTTYGVATTSANGLMSSSDKTKLDGIATGANNYSLPTATSSVLGGVKIGSNITNSSGTISITKDNVTSALGYTPPTQDTNTHYESKNVVGSNTATSNTTSALSNGNVYLNSVENNAVTSSHKISGSGATSVTTDASGNIIISSTNTTYSNATTSAAGLMSSSDKTKLDGIATGANKTVVDSSLSSSSTNPVQNKVIYNALSGKLNASLKGSNNGLAELDENGKVPSSQLPSYVDDVIDGYLNNGKFYSDSEYTTEITGETGKIYINLSNSKTYRWSGSAFVVISETIALGETSSTAYRGDRGKIAYTHSQLTSGNPHGVTKSDIGLGNVENKSSATIRGELTKANVTAALGYTPPTQDTNTHYTSKNVVGSNTATSNTTSALTNGNVYLNSVENNAVTSSHKISGSGATSVTTDTNGNIIISSTNTTYSNATTSAAGLMSSSDKTKLDGIATGANKYTLPTASSSTLGGVKTGSNITNSSGTISITKANVVNALGYTPPEPDLATSNNNGLMSSDDKAKLDGIATGANKYVLPTASSTLGGVKTTSTITEKTGYTATPIINGIPYYKGLDSLILLTDEDLNDYKTAIGQYYAGGTNTCTNVPDGVKAFNLSIYRSGAITYVQRLSANMYVSNKNREYIRIYYSETDSWSEWFEFYSSNNKQPDADPTQHILTSKDLNDVKDYGEYYAGGGNTCANKPDNVSCFYLKVGRGSNTNEYIVQELVQTNVTNPKKFIRLYKDDAWSEWDQYYTSKNKMTKSDIGLDNVENKSSATIRGELTKANVTAALGYTPPTQDTDTHYESKNVIGSNTSTSNTTSALTNGNVYLNSVENNAVTSSHKISGSGATSVTTDANGNIVISSTNTTYSTATTSANGLMSSSDKSKLDGIATGANKTVVDSTLSDTSTNPVQNKVVYSALSDKSDTDHTHNYAGSSSAGGSADSAVKLQTARTINGVNFDGTTNITITANPTQTKLTNEDLDTIKTYGEYYAGGGNTCANVPGGAKAFNLKVYRSASGYIVQELIVGTSSGAYKKYSRQYSTSWTEWKYYIDSSNIYDIAFMPYVGYSDDDILGLEVDYENNTYTRLAGATGLSAGTDFDNFNMYGGRKRCLIHASGVLGYYGDEAYTNNIDNVQSNGLNVMVYQPRFYYKIVPIKLERNTDGIGYYMKKGRYYISDSPKSGFKLHPAFYDEDGNELEGIYYSAYENSIRQISNDGNTTTYTSYLNNEITSYNAKYELESIPGAIPCNAISITDLEKFALPVNPYTDISSCHLETIKTLSANQLLMMIEYGSLNLQNTLNKGISTLTSATSPIVTGGTESLGNTSGMASGTEGEVSFSYRGMENIYGNIFKSVQGILLFGNGNKKGGQPYIAKRFNYDYSTDPLINYDAVNFYIPSSGGYIKYFGYDENFDWLFLPVDVSGSSTAPVGDYIFDKEINDTSPYKISYGGRYKNKTQVGPFTYSANIAYNSINALSETGGRVVYYPKYEGNTFA